jgi:hypothetical protein
MKIDVEIYNGYEIQTHYNKETKCFSATSKIGNSNCPYSTELKNFCGGFKTPNEAVDNVKKMINAFLAHTPKTYESLAKAITESLVWTGYEDCYADTQIIEHLVSGFIKANQR